MNLLILNLYIKAECIQASIHCVSLNNSVLASQACMPSSVSQSLFIFSDGFEVVNMAPPFFYWEWIIAFAWIKH